MALFSVRLESASCHYRTCSTHNLVVVTSCTSIDGVRGRWGLGKRVEEVVLVDRFAWKAFPIRVDVLLCVQTIRPYREYVGSLGLSVI